MIRQLLPLALVLMPAGLAMWRRLRGSLPVVEGELYVRGLEGDVEVHRDAWGVPHVYGGSNADLFFGQGFVHAQDRLWQMELHRRMSQGLLSEALGIEALEVDRFFRRLGLHRVAGVDYQLASDETRTTLDAYARGVNAWLEHPDGRLPVEFLLARLKPRPWTALDCLSTARYVSWALSYNWDSELQRERFIARLGPEGASELEPDIPSSLFELPGADFPHPNPLPGGEETMRRPRLSSSERHTGEGSPPLPLGEGWGEGDLDPGLGIGRGSSNAWVVSGKKSVTGRPLLACDPHLLLRVPSIWYEVHLNGGDYHVAGASLAGTPGVVIGHNERIAWGVTLGMVDLQDLYVERLDPGDPSRYEYQGRWEQGELVRELIPVRGRAEPVVEDVLTTRHGPVVTPSAVLPLEDRPLAMRSVALQPSGIANNLLTLNRAASWDEFRQALAGWEAPALHFVYADVNGNIGYQLAARPPVRAKGAGLVPAPGWTGEYEWLDWVPFEELPTSFNPRIGYVATANNRPEDAASGRRGDAECGEPALLDRLSREWAAPYRYERICQVLESRPLLSARNFRDLQMDVMCLPGVEVAAWLCSLADSVGDGEPSALAQSPEKWALDKLQAWDGTLGGASVGGALFETFKVHFLQRRYGDRLAELLPYLFGHGWHPVVDPNTSYYLRLSVLLVETVRRHGYDQRVRAEARAALRDAVDFLRQRLGPDPTGWQWGRLHRVTLHHAMSAKKPLNLLFDLGPYPVGGDSETPLKTASMLPSLEADGAGPAYRLICDPANWDNSLSVLPGGQSGQRHSRHYADQMPLWLSGAYHPMPFSRRAVESHTQATLRLKR